MKPRIGIFGRMNAGKSTLLNFLTGENAVIVSPQAGTTTDPVRKAFELLDFGPVIFIDTAGFDDTSELGRLRVQKTLNTLHEVDLLLFVPMAQELDDREKEFLAQISKPYITVSKPFDISILETIKTKLKGYVELDFFGGRISKGETVVLVCLIDSQAPVGKLIMPQIMALRAALDLRAVAVTVQPSELEEALQTFAPKLVVTDSQAFALVSDIVGQRAELTSFSILLSEMKSDPKTYTRALDRVDELHDGDRILIIEHCSHQTNCDDIARVKIPQLLQQYTDRTLSFDFINGRDPMPDKIASYALLVQCGGCIATRGALLYRVEQCTDNGVPITNYGMLLRKISGRGRP